MAKKKTAKKKTAKKKTAKKKTAKRKTAAEQVDDPQEGLESAIADRLKDKPDRPTPPAKPPASRREPAAAKPSKIRRRKYSVLPYGGPGDFKEPFIVSATDQGDAIQLVVQENRLASHKYSFTVGAV